MSRSERRLDLKKSMNILHAILPGRLTIKQFRAHKTCIKVEQACCRKRAVGGGDRMTALGKQQDTSISYSRGNPLRNVTG